MAQRGEYLDSYGAASGRIVKMSHKTQKSINCVTQVIVYLNRINLKKTTQVLSFHTRSPSPRTARSDDHCKSYTRGGLIENCWHAFVSQL